MVVQISQRQANFRDVCISVDVIQGSLLDALVTAGGTDSVVAGNSSAEHGCGCSW